MAIFFADAKGQHLIPEQLMIAPGDPGPQATEMLERLLEGPKDPHLRKVLPTGLRLREPVTVSGGVARVNLSGELMNLKGQAVELAMGSLLLSLTEIGGVDRVQFLVDGEKRASLGDNYILDEPLGRPFYGDRAFTPDPERIRYLQGRLDKEGAQRWRADPAGVLQFEGRMFGFTVAQLQAVELKVELGAQQAEARIPYRDTLYTIHLARNAAAKKNGIWSVTGITSQRLNAGMVPQPLYFADRQAVNVIPEARALPDDERLATAVVEALLAGPTDPYLAKTFPPGTKLLEQVTVSLGVATVNLSGEFRQLQGSAESSRAVDSLLYTLTDVPGIDQVQILVDGQKGVVVGNYKFDEPVRKETVSEQYYLDPERLNWLQERVNKGEETWRLDPLSTLVWEGRALGFSANRLRGAKLEQQVDRALARLTYREKEYVIELGRNPGDRGIWFIKSVTLVQ
ncbi:MAG: GerMN domain-containing protein [Bacillota bacterium]